MGTGVTQERLNFILLEAYQKVHSPAFSSYFLLLRFLKALSNRLALASSLGISDLKRSIASVASGLGQRMAEDLKKKVTEEEEKKVTGDEKKEVTDDVKKKVTEDVKKKVTEEE